MEIQIIEELAKLATSVGVEKEHEIQQYELLLKGSSIAERKKEGLTWFPVDFTDKKYSLSSLPLVKIERNPGDKSAHQFQTGSQVAIFSEDSDEFASGTVYSVDEQSMWIGLRKDEFPDFLEDQKLGVNLSFDSKTFFEMEKALNLLINISKGRVEHLRNVIYGEKKPEFITENCIESAVLNDSQNEAINGILNSKDLMIVHGPPGTGKTTTLVESIVELSKQSSAILVCAPSNAAVDHLSNKLIEKNIDITRLGNPAKVNDTVMFNTLEAKLRSLKEYKQVEFYKKNAIDLRNKASKYKRNFGESERKERRSFYREARELLREARELENYLIDRILEKSPVICTTLVGSASHYLNNYLFDVVFIDEAAQALEPACWIPILKSERVVMAGDPHQLPPTVKSFEAEKMGLSKTLMEKSMALGNPSILLNVQYRMHHQIMEFSNSWFYNNELKAFEGIAHHTLTDDSKPVDFIDTAGCGFDEVVDQGKYSKSNPGEIEVIERIIDQLDVHDDTSVAVISPYKEQVNLLKSKLSDKFDINTIDSFQGQERDVVIISLVRSNSEGEIGFLSDYRRMNVAMTRARKKLIVVGDSATIGQDKFYEAFLNYCESNEFYRSAWDYLY